MDEVSRDLEVMVELWQRIDRQRTLLKIPYVPRLVVLIRRRDGCDVWRTSHAT